MFICYLSGGKTQRVEEVDNICFHCWLIVINGRFEVGANAAEFESIPVEIGAKPNVTLQ